MKRKKDRSGKVALISATIVLVLVGASVFSLYSLSRGDDSGSSQISSSNAAGKEKPKLRLWTGEEQNESTVPNGSVSVVDYYEPDPAQAPADSYEFDVYEADSFAADAAETDIPAADGLEVYVPSSAESDDLQGQVSLTDVQDAGEQVSEEPAVQSEADLAAVTEESAAQADILQTDVVLELNVALVEFEDDTLSEEFEEEFTAEEEVLMAQAPEPQYEDFSYAEESYADTETYYEEPVYEEYTEPVYEEWVEPVYEEYSEPVYEEWSEPVYEEWQEPVYEEWSFNDNVIETDDSWYEESSYDNSWQDAGNTGYNDANWYYDYDLDQWVYDYSAGTAAAEETVWYDDSTSYEESTSYDDGWYEEPSHDDGWHNDGPDHHDDWYEDTTVTEDTGYNDANWYYDYDLDQWVYDYSAGTAAAEETVWYDDSTSYEESTSYEDGWFEETSYDDGSAAEDNTGYNDANWYYDYDLDQWVYAENNAGDGGWVDDSESYDDGWYDDSEDWTDDSEDWYDDSEDWSDDSEDWYDDSEDWTEDTTDYGNYSLGQQIVDYAMGFVGVTPYVWAGRSLWSGTDCSGFVNLIYDAFGIYCSTASLAYNGSSFGYIISYDELQPGDIVVYGGGDHVAIYAGDGYVVHCSSPQNGTVYWNMNYRSDISWFLRVL